LLVLSIQCIAKQLRLPRPLHLLSEPISKHMFEFTPCAGLCV
jgi:hypothetical protein